MKGSRFVGVLGVTTGIIFILLGFLFVVGGQMITATVDSMLLESSRGLRTASEAIRSSTQGISSSTGMVEEVRLSLEGTSEVVSGTGVIIGQTVTVLNEVRVILPLIGNDMASMPSMVRNLMPANHFNEVAERTETVASELSALNLRLEDLAIDVFMVVGSIERVSSSLELMEEDLLSTEGSFNAAAENMELAAATIDTFSYTGLISLFSAVIGILMFLTGLYHISTGIFIRKIAKEQASR